MKVISTPKPDAIDANRLRLWKTRWKTLADSRMKNDYGVAELANEIFAEFPSNTSGELQFRQFVRKHFQCPNSRTLLEKAKAFSVYTEEEWFRYGGWMGVSFLQALPAFARKKVLNNLASTGPGPYLYYTIRERAFKLGISSRRKGRDNRTQSEAKIEVLRTFISNLYKQRMDLPPIPTDVQKALARTVLSEISGKLKAA